MAKIVEFHHAVADQGPRRSLSFDAEAAREARIRIDENDEGQLRVQANRAGWLHLARVCAELGLGNFAPGFTLRLDYDFRWGAGSGPEIVLERLDDQDEA